MLLAATVLALLLGGAWEWYWRDYGVRPGYRDDNALWAIQRRQVDTTGQDATVLIGSSRIFFDVQLPVWERLSAGGRSSSQSWVPRRCFRWRISPMIRPSTGAWW